MDPLLTIGFVGGAYGLTLAAATYSAKRTPSLAQRTLAVLLAVIGLAVLTIVSGRVLPGTAHVLETLELTLSLASGPLLLAFVTAAGSRDFRIGGRHLLHLTPSVLAVLWPVVSGAQLVQDRAIPLLQLPYTVAALWSWRRTRTAQPPWSLVLIGSFAAIHVAQLARTFGGSSLRNVVPAMAAAALLFLGGAAWRRVHDAQPAGPKYARSGLTSDDARLLISRIEQLLTDERLYTDATLTLTRIAERLGVSAQSISQALNQHASTTFNQLVTRYRLEAARTELLTRPAAELKIEAVALNAGFASRSSFYDAFRRAYGTTPTRYREAELSNPVGSDNVG